MSCPIPLSPPPKLGRDRSARGKIVVSRRSDRQDLPDRLTPVDIAVIVDEWDRVGRAPPEQNTRCFAQNLVRLPQLAASPLQSLQLLGDLRREPLLPLSIAAFLTHSCRSASAAEFDAAQPNGCSCS